MNSTRRQHITFEFRAQVLIWTSRLTYSVTLFHKSSMRTGSLPSMLDSPRFEDGGWVISYLETIFTLKSSIDPTQADRIVLLLDYIKRHLVNMRDDAKTGAVLTQLQQVNDSLLDERHLYINREGNVSGHSTQTADTWKTYFLNREQTLKFLLEKGFKAGQSWPNCWRCLLKPSVTAKYNFYLVQGQRR